MRATCLQIVFSSAKETDELGFQVDSFAAPEPWLLRAASRAERDSWLAALRDHRAQLYMNGTLMKRGKVTKRWKFRYVLLVGPDLHWSRGESKPWLGTVSGDGEKQPSRCSLLHAAVPLSRCTVHA